MIGALYEWADRLWNRLCDCCTVMEDEQGRLVHFIDCNIILSNRKARQ